MNDSARRSRSPVDGGENLRWSRGHAYGFDVTDTTPGAVFVGGCDIRLDSWHYQVFTREHERSIDASPTYGHRRRQFLKIEKLTWIRQIVARTISVPGAARSPIAGSVSESPTTEQTGASSRASGVGFDPNGAALRWTYLMRMLRCMLPLRSQAARRSSQSAPRVCLPGESEHRREARSRAPEDREGASQGRATGWSAVGQ